MKSKETKFTHRITPEEEKAMGLLQRISKERTRNKAINYAIRTLPMLKEEKEKIEEENGAMRSTFNFKCNLLKNRKLNKGKSTMGNAIETNLCFLIISF